MGCFRSCLVRCRSFQVVVGRFRSFLARCMSFQVVSDCFRSFRVLVRARLHETRSELMVHACLNYDSHIYLEIFSANKKSIRLCGIFMVSHTLWKCKCFFSCKETSLETKVFNPFPYGFSTIIFSREMVQPWFFVTFDLIIRRTFF